MDLSNPDDLVDLGLLVMIAEDMHRDGMGTTPDVLDPRIAGLGWKTVALLTAHDAILPPPGMTLPLQIASSPIYYGYVACQGGDSTQFVVAVRGTAGIAEWIIDGQFFWVPHPRAPGSQVEHGFWDIYSTMALISPEGAPIDENAARGIATLVGGAGVTIAGHSLGSALATYLSFDVATLLGTRAQACMFASPRTGDAPWAMTYDRTVTSYTVVNYILDIVPHLPTRPAYATLPKERLIEPNNAQAAIRLDAGCNHHLVCYCAMLSYGKTMGAPLNDGDRALLGCVVGDASQIGEEERAMATAVKLVGSTPVHVSTLFRGMFALNLEARRPTAPMPAAAVSPTQGVPPAP